MLLEGELFEGVLLEGAPFDGDDWLLDDPEDDPAPPEPDDGGSEVCAGDTTGICGWEAAMVDDGFPPQPTNAMRKKSITTANPEFL